MRSFDPKQKLTFKESYEDYKSATSLVQKYITGVWLSIPWAGQNKCYDNCTVKYRVSLWGWFYAFMRSLARWLGCELLSWIVSISLLITLSNLGVPV